jgi:hypothetical protein
MRHNGTANEEEEPLVDTTVAIPLRSKRTERKQKKLQEKTLKYHTALVDLPSELLVEILEQLRPCDVFVMLRVSKPLRKFVQNNEASIANGINQRRYYALSQCFRLPVLFQTLDERAQIVLQRKERQERLGIRKNYYQHIQPPNPQIICTCWACIQAWNNLCLVLDFASWQKNLDRG